MFVPQQAEVLLNLFWWVYSKTADHILLKSQVLKRNNRSINYLILIDALHGYLTHLQRQQLGLGSEVAWASYQIRKIAGCACAGNAGNVFPRRRLHRTLLVSDSGMHHGTCVTHVPWCMSGSLHQGWRGKRSRHYRRMRTRSFTYLVRGPWWWYQIFIRQHTCKIITLKRDLHTQGHVKIPTVCDKRNN